MVDGRASLLLLISFVYGCSSDNRFPRKVPPTVNPVLKDKRGTGDGDVPVNPFFGSMTTPFILPCTTVTVWNTALSTITPKMPPTRNPFSTSALSGLDCDDNPSANCAVYNTAIICDTKGIYYPWARRNCRLRCGFCQKPCKDDPSAQCELYNAAALCDPNGVYFGWALSRCPDHCGLCPATTTPLISTVPSLQSSYPFSLCKDTVDCRVYNASKICVPNGKYFEWSKQNCPAYCAYCQAPTRIIPCSDKLTNCVEYPPDLCSNNFYRVWVADNCRKFCGLCSGLDRVIDYSSVVG